MDKQLEHSPKLKMARLEIEEVLNKYDIGAAVMLHEPGFTEMILKVDPSYSCAYLDGKNFKVRAPLIDPTDETKHKKIIAETVNFLANMRVRLGQYTMAFTQAEMMVRQEFNIQPPAQKKPPPGINNNHKKN
jgi:hypothetical protein